MPQGILYAAIAVVWAVVLIPMWLRKHDESNQVRSVDRFSRAMGSLSVRRGAGGGDASEPRQVVMPKRPSGAQETVVQVKDPMPVMSPAGLAAARRRRVLWAFVGLIALVGIAVRLHTLPVWSVLVPIVLLVVFLVTVRRSLARAAAMARRRELRTDLTYSARIAERHYRDEPVARRGSRAMMPDVVLDAPARADTALADAVLADLDDGSWHAVPTTLPTYVTAPAATRVPRMIDLRTPGAWSGAAMLDQARATRQEEPADTSGMRVESFEIAVPAASAASSFLDASAGVAELDATDDEAVLAALLEDPRSGVALPGRNYKQAAG